MKLNYLDLICLHFLASNSVSSLSEHFGSKKLIRVGYEYAVGFQEVGEIDIVKHPNDSEYVFARVSSLNLKITRRVRQ